VHAILIVRLGALGDIVHALPLAAALRARFPEARLDWVVDERHLPLLELVPVVDRRIVWRSRSRSIAYRIAELRRGCATVHYDAALDPQGLIKSAVVARASGASRVIGFAAGALREPLARYFYTETHAPPDTGHVIRKNLTLAAAVDAQVDTPSFPLEIPETRELDIVQQAVGGEPYVVLNPGAAWPNKRWSPSRFGELARVVSARHGLTSVVTWGGEDHARATAVVETSDGQAILAPATDIPALAALVGGARLVVSGDTGPMHLASALGTPVVALHGPTDPGRNGPWDPLDITVSRYDSCRCQQRRRCSETVPCLEELTVAAVVEAVERRLAVEERQS